MGTDDPHFGHIAGGGAARAKTTPPNPAGQKQKKKQNERIRRTPYQGIAYAMPNTTAAERKEQRKNETGRNNTANKIQKTTQQK